jgi:hypothetical protein
MGAIRLNLATSDLTSNFGSGPGAAVTVFGSAGKASLAGSSWPVSDEVGISLGAHSVSASCVVSGCAKFASLGSSSVGDGSGCIVPLSSVAGGTSSVEVATVSASGISSALPKVELSFIDSSTGKSSPAAGSSLSASQVSLCCRRKEWQRSSDVTRSHHFSYLHEFRNPPPLVHQPMPQYQLCSFRQPYFRPVCLLKLSFHFQRALQAHSLLAHL